MGTAGAGAHAQKRGIALLIVMSIIVLLATMAFSFHDMVASNLAIARKDVDRFAALQLARAGLNLAIMLVKMDQNFVRGDYTFLPDTAYASRQAQSGVELTKLEQAYMLLSASEASGMPLEHGTVAVKMRDEMARVNVNTTAIEASPKLLVNLLRTCNVRKRKKLVFSDTHAADDVSLQLAASIKDWVDTDATVTAPEGAESTWYSAQTPKYRPRNRPLESIDELMLVRHMDRSIMSGVPANDRDPGSLGIRDFLTVYGSTKVVNVNSAEPAVLKSIPGIMESPNREKIVADLVSRRPITSGMLNAILNENDSSATAQASQYLTTRSNMLRIRVTAHLGSFDGTLETVIVREPSFIRFLYWREI
ncbi:MAG: general secretion pathway protein GspK [Candidatus Riflebacteria bacterium]|nr:general secretion pathway protein GspK [Candidatus Riflebacteria bacterium]